MAVYDCKECGYVIVLHGRISGRPCPKHRAEFEAEFGKQFISPLDHEEPTPKKGLFARIFKC